MWFILIFSCKLLILFSWYWLGVKINCFLIKFTEVLPDALKTDCSKCTEIQKDRSEKVIRFLIKNRSADFDHLIAKYDPSGEYKKKIEKFDAEKAAAAKH